MPPEPIRWLHLSDFHVGKDDYETRKIFGYIHNHVAEQCENGFVPDMLFVTGDIANYGKEEEYSKFIEEFFEPLKKILSEFAWFGKIFIVPGNHDLRRAIVEDVARDSRLSPKSEFFRADITGKNKRAIHEIRAFEKFGNFVILADLHPDNWLNSEEGTFADVFELKGKKIGVAGMNTAWLSRDDKDQEKLSPGIDLVESAINRIMNCDLRILLGHHPLDWFYPSHRTRILNLLGDYRIIYLHGHLHENRSQPLETGGGKFLQIQSGAAFQVNDLDETKWKNGLLWAEVTNELDFIRLQPRYWKSSERRWGFDDDLHEDRKKDKNTNWWSFPLPSSQYDDGEPKAAKPIKETKPVTIPKGWELIDHNFIDTRSKSELGDDYCIHYFDGAIPTWHRDFINTIPRRNATVEAINFLRKAKDGNRPSMVLLSGAGGEGKSTALIQTAFSLYESGGWNLLWHTHDKSPLEIKEIRDFPTNRPWLIISDDADLFVENLIQLIPWVAQNRRDVHFLLAARKSDWFSAGGTKIGWGLHCQFREIVLGKLDPNESESIIKLWSEYGVEGLKNLYGVEPEIAAQRLLQASIDEGGKGEGAFLGAMLKIRMSGGLKDHVRLLLSRIQSQEIKQSGGKSLLDAFATIAFMHAERLDFLSSLVLSQYIYDNYDKSVKGSVLIPLGKEAAATSAGSYVYTRHSIIAKVATELLEEDFGIDPEEIFSSLGAAAIIAKRNRAFVPDLEKWNFDFPKHFLESGRQRTAIAIGKAELTKVSDDLRLLTNLAQLYRKSDNHEQAVLVFREYSSTKGDRGFYYEWGTTEGSAGNNALSVLLDAISLSDRQFSVVVKNDQAKLSLAGMGVAFENVFTDYHDIRFRDGRCACGILGMKLDLDPKAKNYLKQHYETATNQGAPKMEIDQAFEALNQGVMAAWEYADIDEALLRRLPDKTEISFEGLQGLIRRAMARKKA